MGRVEAVAKAMFYPTPDRVVQAVARHLAPANVSKSNVIRVLDPCCGTGEPVAYVTDALGGVSYGVELSSDRSDHARSFVDHLVPSNSAFAMRLSNNAFSCLFLNPPYDYDDEGQRLEQSFLHHMHKALTTGGVLVFIVPQKRLGVSARTLATWFSGHRIFRFPDPEFGAFGQVVVFATRRHSPAYDPALEKEIAGWMDADLPELPDEPVEALYKVPACADRDVLFAPSFYDPELAQSEADRVGAWTRRDFVELLMPPEHKPVRPLMPLAYGHLAMLIAAGMLDDSVLEQDGQQVLVKGSVHKVMVDVATEEENTSIQREKLVQKVVMLDLSTWTYVTIQEQEVNDSSDTEDDEQAA